MRSEATLRVALWALALLWPGGCGGAGPASQDDCGVPNQVRIEGVSDLPAGRLGQTDRCAPGGTLIQVVEPALVGDGGARLVAHELAHAAGHGSHLDDPACVLYPIILGTLPPPCPQELMYLRGVPGPLYVQTTLEPRTAITRAVDYWNSHLQRELFVLAPP